MGESVFEVVKQSVTVREAAELYGIAVGRSGMACCPFHDDRHPSMKVDARFHCFGCGADGDVIDFTARLYDLSPKEAAEKLAQDFGLSYDNKAPPRRSYVRQKSEAQVRKEKREHGWRVLTDYYHLLRKWEADYSPKMPDEDPHPRFLEAIQKKDYMGYLLDTFLDSSTEEQDQWIAEHTAEISAIEGRVNIMADKPTNRERLQQITAGIEQGIKELFESEKYMRYLSVMSRFHRYSVNNTMLIYMQKPDATLVAGYNKWKNQFERHVKRGEHGITIIAPTPFKKKIEEQKLDPDTKAPILDAEGKAVMEEREVEIPMFRPVKVFDVSQTDGKPLPELASTLSGNVQNYEAFMEALRRSAPVPLSVEPMAANMDGYFSPDRQRIAIRAGMSEVQTVSAAVHEIAHSKLHNYAKAQEEAVRAGDKEPPKKKDRNTEEVEAESISYAVCQYYGIQTGENSFGYIANWSQGKELPELRASLETINKTAGELINDIDRHYKVICKERGIDLTAAPEPQLDPIEQLAADIDQFSFDYDTYEYRDQVDNREDALRELTATLRSGDASGVRDWLQEFADENEPGEAVTKAAELLDRLDQLVPEPDPNLVKMADEARAMGVDTAWNSDKEFPVSFDTERTQPSAEAQEALLLVDDATYLHVQSCDTGWDYTLYDAATMKQLDGGQLDAPELSLSTAALKICEMRGMGGQSIRYAPLSMIETLQEAAIQQMQAAAQAAVPEVTQLPDAPEQALDEYPMPDPALTQDDLEKCGYLDSDLLPLSKERAYELMAQDLTVYMVQQGENPAMAFDTADLDAHDGIFAVTREEWEDSPSFDAQVMDRMDHQQEREQAFLNHKGDCYAIYQVKHTDELRDIRYEGLEWVKSIGRTVQRDNYDLVYTAPLTPGDLKGSVLDNLEYRFNNEHPADYRHPSMSVSDIVAIKQDGKVSCHYCDSFGFQQIPGFLPDNPLKSAEMTVEDDYGMIDGVINNGTKEPTVAQLEQQARSGQPISLMDLAAAAHREDRDKKKSVMDQLKSQPKSEHKKTAPKKSAEREI
ncbi:LPD16 domain-containing protein [Subdoligranulum variabile]|uniref:CHC2 zinc finger domain protein n=1 Tax=Subdoligranulum variabile DSM 15176 TaxID=411471 RepID=D1PJD6_9FIRM|nr:LPD16 domain-containing protein [Subdoligranulum variabile]EFB77296.1 CHC2 zinc finger domain protein [Subdoligranulum variabile DSM 15176]UWP67512.1 YodL domain-containing protein [Subdoligranulum variabile]